MNFGFEIETKGQTPALFNQVHGNRVLSLNQHLEKVEEADGAITTSPRELYVFTADCIPLLLYSKTHIAALHCGWRSVQKNIILAALTQLKSSGDGPIRGIMGPAIRGCCYEVKNDLIEAFLKQGQDIAHAIEQRRDKLFFDLPTHLKSQLESRGVSLDLQALRCTFCSQPELPSYRRNGNTEQRIRSWIKHP